MENQAKDLQTINFDENEVKINKSIDNYIKTFLTHQNLQPHEVEMFRNVAKAQKLDPFKKELHVVAYGEGRYRELSLITGYEVYLRRADLIPVYDFFETEYIGNGVKDPEFRCRITVFRTDRKRPFVHECYYNEFVGRKKDGTITRFWNRMPRFMLKKVTMGQTLRMAFPNDFAGMPYLREEINEISDVTPKKTTSSSMLDKVKSDLLKEADATVKELKEVKKELQKESPFPDYKSKELGGISNPEKENSLIEECEDFNIGEEIFDAKKSVLELLERSSKYKKELAKSPVYFDYFKGIAAQVREGTFDYKKYSRQQYDLNLAVIEQYEKEGNK